MSFCCSTYGRHVTGALISGIVMLAATWAIAVEPPSAGRGKLDTGVTPGPGASAARTPPRVSLEQLPLLFVENRGQLPHAVAYTIKRRGVGLYFTADGIAIGLATPDLDAQSGAADGMVKTAFKGSARR